MKKQPPCPAPPQASYRYSSPNIPMSPIRRFTWARSLPSRIVATILLLLIEFVVGCRSKNTRQELGNPRDLIVGEWKFAGDVSERKPGKAREDVTFQEITQEPPHDRIWKAPEESVSRLKLTFDKGGGLKIDYGDLVLEGTYEFNSDASKLTLNVADPRLTEELDIRYVTETELVVQMVFYLRTNNDKWVKMTAKQYFKK